MLFNLIKNAVGSDLNHLNLSAMLYMNLSDQFPFESPAPGGYWSPHPSNNQTRSDPNPRIGCRPRGRLWVVVPYRSRPGMLHVFTQHIHHVLQTQRLEYRVVVVEQMDNDALFNKAKIFNAAVSEIARHTLERWLPRDGVGPKPDKFIHCETPATELTANFNLRNQPVILDRHRINFSHPTKRGLLNSSGLCKSGTLRAVPVPLKDDECFLFHGIIRTSMKIRYDNFTLNYCRYIM